MQATEWKSKKWFFAPLTDRTSVFNKIAEKPHPHKGFILFSIFCALWTTSRRKIGVGYQLGHHQNAEQM